MVHTLSRKILQFIPFCGPRFLLPGFVISIDVYPTICFKICTRSPTSFENAHHRRKTTPRAPQRRPKGAPRAAKTVSPRPQQAPRRPKRPQQGACKDRNSAKCHSSQFCQCKTRGTTWNAPRNAPDFEGFPRKTGNSQRWNASERPGTLAGTTLQTWLPS